MQHKKLVLAVVAVALLAAKTPSPPATEKHPVTDRYHGVAVVDDYRWLEDARDPKASIDWLVATPQRLFVTYQTGGPSELRVFGLDGKDHGNVPALPVSTVGSVAVLGDDAVVFGNGSFLQPWNWFAFDAATGKTRPTALNVPMPVKFDDAEVERVMVTSKDGTKVPLNIIKRKGTKLDGTNPTLLTGYGGYGISMTPGFSVRRRLWLDVGGVWAVANLRGGGELGESWHHQGSARSSRTLASTTRCAPSCRRTASST